MTRSLRRRIWESLAAMTFARAVQVGYVFILVPILLSQWGVEIYGEWLILTAVASFGALANFGMFQASAVEISLATGEGDRDRASKIAATTMAAGVAFAALLLLIAWIGLSLADAKAFFGVSAIAPRNAVLVAILALASVVLAMLIPVLAAALNVTVGSALPTMVGAMIRIVELIATAVAVYAGGGPVSVALVLVGSVFLNLVFHFIVVRILTPWLSLNPWQFEIATLRRLIRPSLGQFLLYISANIFVIQAPRIILGHLAGAAAVAVFGVTVTYMRAARTLTTLFSQSLQVETTRAFAEKRHDVFIKLVEGLCQTHLWISLAAMVALMVLGVPIFSVWTHGKIAFDVWLCLFLGIGFVIGAYGDALVSVLLGINRAMALAVGHLSATIVALAISVPLILSVGTTGMAAALILPEAVIAVVAVLVFCGLLDLRPGEFLLQSVRWPIGLMKREVDRLAGFLFKRAD